MTVIKPWRRLPIAACLVWCLAGSLLSACHKPEPAAAANSEPTVKANSTAEGVTLKPEEIEKMGIVTSAAKTATFTPEKAGFGVVLGHDAIAQVVAEVATAQAAVHQSQAALARVQRLADTPGAFPAENQENAERQAAVDAAALTLAQRRLSASLGQNPPWKGSAGSAALSDLASGHLKLIRVTFPLGTVGNATPHSLRIARLDPNSPSESWQATTVWDAPAEADVPGRSFFALLKDGDAGEGERVQGWAPYGTAESGAVVPAAATIVSDNKYWCYVEKQPGTFVRLELDTSQPLDAGYFVTENIAPGDAIVTTAAGLLLARETNASTEAE